MTEQETIALVTFVGSVLLVIVTWFLKTLGDIRKDVHQLKVALIGVEGQGGLVSEVIRLRDWRHTIAQLIASDHTTIQEHEQELAELRRMLNEA